MMPKSILTPHYSLRQSHKRCVCTVYFWTRFWLQLWFEASWVFLFCVSNIRNCFSIRIVYIYIATLAYATWKKTFSLDIFLWTRNLKIKMWAHNSWPWSRHWKFSNNIMKLRLVFAFGHSRFQLPFDDLSVFSRNKIRWNWLLQVLRTTLWLALSQWDRMSTPSKLIH